MSKSGYIATWIGKSNKISQADYHREIERKGDVFFWDDTRHGHAKEYFVFIDATKKEIIMKIYKIRNISKKPEERLKEWSKHGYIPSQTYDTSTRNLLTIEKECLKEVKWSEYSKDVGYKGALRSTQPLRISDLLKI